MYEVLMVLFSASLHRWRDWASEVQLFRASERVNVRHWKQPLLRTGQCLDEHLSYSRPLLWRSVPWPFDSLLQRGCFCLFNFDDSVELSFGLLVLASSDPSSSSFGCFIVYPLARAQKDSHGFDNLYTPMNLGCLHLRDIHNQWKYGHLLKEAYPLTCALVISIVDKVIKLLRLKWYCLDSSWELKKERGTIKQRNSWHLEKSGHT